MRHITTIGFLALLLLGLIACSPATEEELPTPPPQNTPAPIDEENPAPEPTAPPEPETSETIGEAIVNEISLNLMESFPLQASVTVQGDLNDGCTRIQEAVQDQQADTIYLTVFTARPADQMCDMALMPFTETFPLDIAGLPAGDYTINVNGVTTTLTLDQDN